MPRLPFLTLLLGYLLPPRIRRSLTYRLQYLESYQRLEARKAALGIASPIVDEEIINTLISIKALLPAPCEIFIDVGAYRGGFALASHAILGCKRSVCVEPNEALASQIRENTYPDLTTVLEVALSDTSGTREFFIHRDQSMSSLLQVDCERLVKVFKYDLPEEITTTSVRVTTLDLLIQELGLRTGNLFIKLDTQGNELEILRGGKIALELAVGCLVEHMFYCPYNRSYRFEDLISYMDAHGFECRGALNSRRKVTGEISGVDFIFVRRGD